MIYNKGDLVKVISTGQVGIVENGYYESRFNTQTSTIIVILSVDGDGIDTETRRYKHEDLEIVHHSSHRDFYMYCKEMFSNIKRWNK